MKKIKEQKNQIMILSIIGVIVLISVFFLKVDKVQENNSKDEIRKQDIENISKALEVYYQDFQHYPYSSKGTIIGCGESASQVCKWGEVWQNSSDKKIYMEKLPMDPEGKAYLYVADPQGKTFSILTFLENKKDKEAIKDNKGQTIFHKGSYCQVFDGILSADSCKYTISND